jgi:hypothetical protein
MMRLLIGWILFIVPLFSVGQASYWVFFTDKAEDSHPALSSKSLDRRIAQQIPLDIHDFPVNSDYVHELKNYSLEVVGTSRWLNAAFIEVKDADIQGIENLPFVERVERSLGYTFVADMDERLDQYVFSNNEPDFYGTAKDQFQMIGADWFFEAGMNGRGMTVAVFDAGFTNSQNLAYFQSVFNEGHYLGEIDFVSDTTVFGFSTHGTLVWGPMAARDSGNYSGLASEADYWLLRTEDVGSEKHIEEYNWLAAAEFADSVGVDVINSSLGYTRFDVGEGDYAYSDLDGSTTIVTRAADMAASRGILVVNSNGNYYNDGWTYMGAPADGDSVLSIGAVNTDEEHAGFSSIGPTYDGRVKPDVVALGEQAVLVHPFGNIVTGNGTSFSSPIVAAASTALWAEFPNATAEEIRHAIRRSAHQYNDPEPYLGYGIPNFRLAYDLLKNEVEVDPKNELLVYPNPFVRDFQVLFPSDLAAEFMDVRLVNSSGQTVYHERKSFSYFTRIILPFDLPYGVYYLDISAAGNNYRYKMIRANDEE